jgi:hypothetical protein
MGVSQGYSSIITNGLVFNYDVADTINSYLGQPITNQFIAYGNSNSDNAVNFPIQGEAGFIRLAAGQVFSGYTIQPNDVVYKYNWNYNPGGCHYHGMTASIPAGAYATFTFEYYISGDTNFSTGNSTYLANFENYGGGALGGSVSMPNYNKGVWQTATFTSGPAGGGGGTQAMFLYPGGCGGNIATTTGFILYRNPRVYWLSYDVPFVNGTRSNTQALLDLSGTKNTIPLNTSYDNKGQFYFDGTDDKIDVSYYSPVNNSMSRSWEVIVRPTATMSYGAVFGNKLGYGCSYHCNGGIYLWDSNWVFDWYDNSAYQFLYSSIPATANQNYHVVGTYDAVDQRPRIYVNGVLRNTYGPATNMNYGGETYVIDIGYNSSGISHYFQGYIPVAKYHQNKALSAGEVLQNYNHYKTRYNLS